MHVFYGSEKTSKRGPQAGSRVFAGFFFLVAPQKLICQQILLSHSAFSSSLLVVEALQQNLHQVCCMKQCKNSKHHGEAPAWLGAVAGDAERPHTAVLTAGVLPWLFPHLSCSCHSQSQLLFLGAQRLGETAVGKFITLRVFQSKWQSIGTRALINQLGKQNEDWIFLTLQQGLDVMSRSQCWSFEF